MDAAKPSLSDLARGLCVLPRPETIEMAVQLGMDFDYLINIDPSMLTLTAMNRWLRSDPSASWRRVVSAFKAIRYNVLALRLESNTRAVPVPHCEVAATPWLLVKMSRKTEPVARAFHAAVGVGQTLLVWGGTGDVEDTSLLLLVETFDVVSPTWREARPLKGDPLTSIRRFAVTSDGEKAYVFGGYSDSGSHEQRLFDINLTSLECRELVPRGDSLSIPSARTNSAIVCSERRLVMYGGSPNSGVAADDLNVFDLDENTWSAPATTGDKPPGLWGHTLTSVDSNRAVLFGGYDGSNYHNDAYLVEMETWRWGEVKIRGKKPPARIYHAACCIATGSHPLVVVVGGQGSDGAPLSDVWILNVKIESWNEVTLPTPITPRWGHSGVVFGVGADFRVVVLCCGLTLGDLLSETTLLLLGQRGGSWVVDRVVGPADWQTPDDSLRNQLRRLVFLSTENAEAIVQTMLKEEGKIKQKNMVVVITGLMGAGKTTLLHRLFNKIPPDKYTSTGVAERSWRGLGLTKYTLDRKNFKLLENNHDMLELVAKVKKVPSAKEQKSDEGKISSFIETSLEQQKSATAGKQIPSEENKIGNGSQESEVSIDMHELPAVGDDSNATVGYKSQEKSLSIREMADIVRRNPMEYEGELEIVHMIDTGGQPESLEIMPTLIHNSDLIVLVIDLSKSLDECTVPTLHKESRKFQKKPLLMCNKQLIKQLAQTMTGRSDSKILIVATHKDKVSENVLPKALEDLNSFVEEVLPRESLKTNVGRQIVFVVDLIHRDETLQRIHENIISIKMDPLFIPPSFMLFESDTLHYINEKKKDGRNVEVMEFEECVEIGKRLDMTREVVEAALIYFHKNNILLFFKDVGKGLMFFEPEILLSFINTIINFSYKAIEGEQYITPSLDLSQIDSLHKGMITEGILEHKCLTENFVPGLFEASHAIQIFKKFYIIAEGSVAQISAEEKSIKTYIMMCLLPYLSEENFEEKVCSLIEKSGNVEPLLINFIRKGSPPNCELSCSPTGSFGNTVACLISKYEWKICTDSNNVEPEFLTHDIVTLQHKSLPVTLVNMTTYFEVYAHPKDVKEYENLPEVRREIVGAVKEVLKNMHVDHTVAEGFKCTCGRKGVFHTQYLREDPQTSARCEFSPEEKPKSYWVKGSMTQLSSTEGASSELSPSAGGGQPTLPELLRPKVPQEVGANYTTFGVLLLNDTTGNRVGAIEDECRRRPERICLRILQEWLAGKGLPVDWQTLIETLRKSDCHALADTVQAAGASATPSCSSTSPPPTSEPVPSSVPATASSATPSSSSTSPPPTSGCGQPTLPELLRLKVPQEVGTNYITFGVLLLNDTTGCQVRAMENMFCRDGKRICLEILQEWLAGKGLSVDWQTLIKTLRDSDLSTLADRVQASVHL